MVDWSKQHNGVHQAEYNQLIDLMPDLSEIMKSFPENPNDFIWDVKVHMLMPGQYPVKLGSLNQKSGLSSPRQTNIGEQ
jgi:hypothetical protein